MFVDLLEKNSREEGMVAHQLRQHYDRWSDEDKEQLWAELSSMFLWRDWDDREDLCGTLFPRHAISSRDNMIDLFEKNGLGIEAYT